MTPQGCEQSGRISLAPLTIPSADMKVAVVNLRSFTYEQLSLSSSFLLFFFSVVIEAADTCVEKDRTGDGTQRHMSRNHPIG